MKLMVIVAVLLVALIGPLAAETLTENAEADSPLLNVVKRGAAYHHGYVRKVPRPAHRSNSRVVPLRPAYRSNNRVVPRPAYRNNSRVVTRPAYRSNSRVVPRYRYRNNPRRYNYNGNYRYRPSFPRSQGNRYAGKVFTGQHYYS